MSKCCKDDFETIDNYWNELLKKHSNNGEYFYDDLSDSDRNMICSTECSYLFSQLEAEMEYIDDVYRHLSIIESSKDLCIRQEQFNCALENIRALSIVMEKMVNRKCLALQGFIKKDESKKEKEGGYCD